MSKNKVPMSLAITPDMHEELKKISIRKGLSASAYICQLLEQAFKLNPDDDAMVIGKSPDDDIVPVVLKVPNAYRSDPEKLKQWMQIQVDGIVKAMVKN